jgi:hypothetical protein
MSTTERKDLYVAESAPLLVKDRMLPTIGIQS